MYHIGICEDEALQREALEEKCHKLLEELEIEYRLSVFENSDQCFAYLSQSGVTFDLLLLDIVMEGTSGMELARRIRKTDELVTIVFITSNPEFAIEGYDVRALNYLMKPVLKDTLKAIIQKDYKNKYEKNYFIFENGTVKQKIWIEDILYLESKGRKVEITMKEEVLFYRGRLTLLLEQLPEGKFFRCHQSFAVNINHMKEFTQQELSALDGKKIPISRKYSKEILAAFMKEMRE